MGKCIRCNKYCKDNHSYCRSCYNNIIFICGECKNPIFADDKILQNENYSLVHEKCYNQEIKESIDNDIRNKYEAKHRTEDGHLVRSRGEVIIDNYLFNKKIMHVYEKKVYANIDNEIIECTTDFYLPEYDIYIEFWGMENNKRYEDERLYKENIYSKMNYKKIDILPENLENGLDDFLTKQLLRYKK